MAGNIYDLVLITYAYTFLNKIVGISYLDLTIIFSLGLIGRVIEQVYSERLQIKEEERS